MFTTLLTAITAALMAFPKLVDSLSTLATAYNAHVKILWAQSLQAGLEPLSQGQPTTDAQKETAAKAVADAIANLK